MFDILWVEMTNFKSFSKTTKFVFPKEPGLYYLTGRNEFSPRLGPNGCGKTTLIDAIEWCCFGRTTRGLKSSDVVTWGKKTANVTMRLVIDGERHTIVRNQSPNHLTIDDEPVEQAELEKLLRLNYEGFNYSIVIPQFGDSFFDLAPTPKLALFSKVLGLDMWLDKSKAASRLATEVESDVHELSKQEASIQGRLETLQAATEDLEGKAKDFESERTEKVKKLKAKKKDLQSNVAELAKVAESQIAEASKGMKEIDRLTDDLQTALSEVDNLKHRKRDLARDVQDLLARRTEVLRGIETLEKLGPTCPKCFQPISKKHLAAHRAEAEEKAEGIMASYASVLAELKKVDKTFETADQNRAEIRSNLEAARGSFESKLRAKTKAEREHRDAVVELRDLDTKIEETQTKKNPYDKLLEENKADIKEAKKRLAKILTDLEGTKELVGAVDYWVKGFKRIRLFVIEESLRALEIEVNNQLASLGLLGWSVKFDVERETKAGGISKGFSVFIQSPKVDKPVRWEAWSGGEVQRLRLAGDLGFANLILEQAGHNNRIEFYDEPSEHLSTEGVEDMVETLYDRAHSQNKRVWLVDHTTIGFGQFSGTLTAVMSKDGASHLEFDGERD